MVSRVFKIVVDPLNKDLFNHACNYFSSMQGNRITFNYDSLGANLYEISNDNIKYQVWVLSPEERFRFIRSIFYKGSIFGLVLADENHTNDVFVNSKVKQAESLTKKAEAVNMDNLLNRVYELGAEFVNGSDGKSSFNEIHVKGSVKDYINSSKKISGTVISNDGFVSEDDSLRQVIIPLESESLENMLRPIVTLGKEGEIDIRISGSEKEGYIAKIEIKTNKKRVSLFRGHNNFDLS